LTFKDLDLTVLDDFDHLLRADIWFSKPMLFGGNEQLFRVAREKGMTVSIDLNWDPLWGIASTEAVQARKQAVRSVLRWVNIAHGNVRELNEFADADRLETSLERLAEWGIEAVVVHLGASGAGYHQAGRLWREPAVQASRHLNTTGTGDLLSVCMMLLHQQPDVPAKLRLANTIVAQFIAGERQFIPALQH
jgi:sugar/nucleoside kinase (ribokinase family)